MYKITAEYGLLIWTVFAAIIFFISLAALINILKSNFTDSTTKLMWVLVVLFVPFFGPIIYFAIGGKHKLQKIN